MAYQTQGGQGPQHYKSNMKERKETTLGDFLGGMVKGIGGTVAKAAAPVNPLLGAAIEGGSELATGILKGKDFVDTLGDAVTGAAVTGFGSSISNAILNQKEDAYLKALIMPSTKLAPPTPEKLLENKQMWWS